MPYGQPQGGGRNAIAQALMNIQQPPPQTQMPQMPPQAGGMQMPQMPAPGAPPQGMPPPAMRRRQCRCLRVWRRNLRGLAAGRLRALAGRCRHRRKACHRCRRNRECH